jgi:hypothetical protein
MRFFVDAAFSPGLPFKMLHGIGDVNFFTVNACFRERLVQQPAGRADKRIFLVTGLFADKDNFRAGQPFAEHGLRGAFPEITGLAILGRCFQFFQRCMWLDRWLSGFWLAFRLGHFVYYYPSGRPKYIPGCLHS